MSTQYAIDAAVLAHGTLAEQMPSGPDPEAQAKARDRLGTLAERLAPPDRELLAIIAAGDEDGGELSHTALAARLGISRQGATRRRRRLYRRVRRAATLPPAPPLPPTDALTEHLVGCAGLTHRAAQRVARVARGATAASVARRQGVDRTAVSRTISTTHTTLDRECARCAAVAVALDVRAMRVHGEGARRATT